MRFYPGSQKRKLYGTQTLWLGRNTDTFLTSSLNISEKDGVRVQEVIEIKPARQVKGPPVNPKRKTANWAKECMTYATNTAKWKAGMEWAENRGMNFRLLTENDYHPGKWVLNKSSTTLYLCYGAAQAYKTRIFYNYPQ